jgi:hypothetical protein
MLNFLFSTFVSLVTGCGTGWTTQEKQDELSWIMKESGKTGYVQSDPGAWKRHLAQFQKPQPPEWRCDDS